MESHWLIWENISMVRNASVVRQSIQYQILNVDIDPQIIETIVI